MVAAGKTTEIPSGCHVYSEVWNLALEFPVISQMEYS